MVVDKMILWSFVVLCGPLFPLSFSPVMRTDNIERRQGVGGGGLAVGWGRARGMEREGEERAGGGVG